MPHEQTDYPRFSHSKTPMEAGEGDAPESRLGERLQTARAFYGLSVDALARLTKEYDGGDASGVSATALRRYEASETFPTARELRLLSLALDVPTDWLIFGRGSSDDVSPADRAMVAALRAWIQGQTASDAAAIQSQMVAGIKAERRREALERARRR